MKLAAVILALLVVAFGYRFLLSDEGLREVWRLRGEVEAQQAENEALLERNRALEAEVADLAGGLDAIEERARAELGLTREGETKFTIVEPDADAAETDPPE